MTFVTESNSSQEQRTQTEALWERIFSAHTQFLLFEFTTCVCSFFDGRAVGLSMCASICVMFRFAVCVCVCSGVIWGWGFGELLLDVIHDEAHEAPPAQGKLRCHDVSKAILKLY